MMLTAFFNQIAAKDKLRHQGHLPRGNNDNAVDGQLRV